MRCCANTTVCKYTCPPPPRPNSFSFHRPLKEKKSLIMPGANRSYVIRDPIVVASLPQESGTRGANSNARQRLGAG